MADIGLKNGAKKMAKVKGGAATGKSKVISSGTFPGVRGGTKGMFGKQSVKPSKAK